jgi:predicted permease
VSESLYLVLGSKMAAMFAVMAVGWWMRRSGWLSAGMTAPLSRLTIEVAFPCLIVDQMLRTLDRNALQQSVPLLTLGVLMMLLSALVGWVLAWGRTDHGSGHRTLAFLMAVPNWIFLPMPLAQAIAGEAGIRTILLLNVPAQLILWTLNLAMLRGRWSGVEGLRSVVVNPGLLATVLAISVAILFPGSGQWHTQATPAGVVLQGMGLLGGMTMPLSLLVTGAQLAETRLAQTAPLAVGRVLVGRLLVAPVLCVLAIEFGGRMVGLDGATRMVTSLVFAMPVAVSCGIFVERYGGDRDLASQSILTSTLASLLTVPLMVALVSWLR